MLKLHLCSSKDSGSTPADQNRKHVRRRQVLTIIFAIVLISIAGVSSAQAPQRESQLDAIPLQYDGVSEVPINIGGAVHTHRLRGDARPAYVELAASLANFDADADPDGWRADVILRDRKDRPVVMRANATFELMPRVPTPENLRYVDADTTPIRWSMPLEFDDDSVARIKLPLRQSLRPMLGWSTALYPASGTFSRTHGHNIHRLSRDRRYVASDLRNLVGMPSGGELRIRVSVPTEGVFEAATGVRLRPSILVDTKWPYR